MTNKENVFENFDFTNFWYEKETRLDKHFEINPPSDEVISEVEAELGYKLPNSYIEFMKIRNGGILEKDSFPSETPNSWADDHVGVSSFLSIGKTGMYTLCGDLGSKFMIENWGYPDSGVYICNCPSAGHDMILLDYSECGKNLENGEPKVVHVDQESDYEITFLAKDFETFVKNLVPSSVFDED